MPILSRRRFFGLLPAVPLVPKLLEEKVAVQTEAVIPNSGYLQALPLPAVDHLPATPALSFNNDSDTGIYYTHIDAVGFTIVTNGKVT